jgi:hypothetical protein
MATFCRAPRAKPRLTKRAGIRDVAHLCSTSLLSISPNLQSANNQQMIQHPAAHQMQGMFKTLFNNKYNLAFYKTSGIRSKYFIIDNQT